MAIMGCVWSPEAGTSSYLNAAASKIPFNSGQFRGWDGARHPKTRELSITA